MLSYHNSPKLKTKLISQMRQHRLADELIRGAYWSDGKGCAVGCLTHNQYGGHAEYPNLLGVPAQLAYLQDHIFEDLEDSAKWPERFLSAIPVGKDLSNIWPEFAQWLLLGPEDGVINYADDDLKPHILTISRWYRGNSTHHKRFASVFASVVAVGKYRANACSARKIDIANAVYYAAVAYGASEARHATTAASCANSVANRTAEYTNQYALVQKQADKLISLLEIGGSWDNLLAAKLTGSDTQAHLDRAANLDSK